MALPAGAAEIIIRKKALYCRLLDTNNWGLADKVMLPDFTFTVVNEDNNIINLNDTDYHWTSLADWVAFFSRTFASAQTMHVVGYPELELVAPDEIKAIFGVTYMGGPKEANKGVHDISGGHYYETWKLRDGDWFVQRIVSEHILLVSSAACRKDGG